MNKRIIATAVASVLLAAGLAQAKVSEEEAARLNGKDLNPYGAEVAGNADGSIPAWEPKWTDVPPGLEYGGPGSPRPDPYADEKPLVIITAENYKEHLAHLSEGQAALFERYPAFQLHVYPTHRDFGYQERMAKKTKWNALHTELVNDGEGLKNYNGGVAFPIPANDREVLWNMRTSGCYTTYNVVYDGYGVFANGERAHDAIDFTQSHPFNNPEDPDTGVTEAERGDRSVWTVSQRLAPQRTKGQITVVTGPMDYKRDKRNAWQYDPGTRRVRKAPAIGYDNPDGPGGMQTIDDHKGFNGPFDRFTYTLLGRKEIYVPFHNFKFNDSRIGTLDDRLTLNFLNPEFVRFEKRRVWVVEGNLAPGKRHAYKKRRWYVEEDSWIPVMSENFDGRDNLWRVGFFLSDYEYQIGCYERNTQVFMDLPSGGYVSNFITIDRKEAVHNLPYLDKDYFTPANLRKLAKR
ncbi:DUF1329 domain-containing protein [Pseudohalioglobus sediminis]|uniref:DUF1329 domain-containing protein n=1 Tax=Pseudohalioglobus sediminis TaxID=2606449 RepID=A0A5B0X6A6_9GAMM|nr:DUF1329 domain-containing protein [Pseudohalioglobus sediminis]KAA1194215.1 DUF1329 domain-containing protein [Pseudohalioglobus sediminis]